MPPETKKSYSILLVDDDKFLLDMYSMKFKGVGCTVEAIADPVAALEKLRGGFVPDIILLDIVMPVMNGFEFLEILRKEHLATGAHIVVLSNQGAQEDIDKSIALGAAGYIVKASSIPSEVLMQAFTIAETKK
jgi:two-component system chemotaxis response regulator CheY